MREKTQRVLIQYARSYLKTGKFEWEKIADEIRSKDLDYPYYESFFTVGRGCYDWVNGNKNWKFLIECIRSDVPTEKIIKVI